MLLLHVRPFVDFFGARVMYYTDLDCFVESEHQVLCSYLKSLWLNRRALFFLTGADLMTLYLF